MSNSLLIVFNTPTNFNSMNVFEIGTNKKYFNEGKTKHCLTNEIVPSIRKSIEFLTPLAKTQPINLLICGRTLSWLNQNSKETVKQLKEFIRLPKVKVITSLYHNSLPETLTSEEFTYQLKLHLNTLKSVLGKKSTTLVVKESLNEDQIKLAQSLGVRNYLAVPSFETNKINYSAEDSLTILSNNVFISKSKEELINVVADNFVTLDKKFISKINWDKLIDKRHELHDHLHSEVANFYPLIKELNDKNSLEDWRLLSASINLNDSNKYDNYMSVMNTLNDIAFKAQNIHLLKQGKEIIQPKLSNNPSELLKNIFTKGEL